MGLQITIEVGDILWIDRGGLVRYCSQEMDDWGELFTSANLSVREKQKLSKQLKQRLLLLSANSSGSHTGPVFKMMGEDFFLCKGPRKVLTLN